MTTPLYVGMDVHKETIAVALANAERNGEVRTFGVIANTPNAVAALIKKLAKPEVKLHCCYEAGPCGYRLYRQIIDAGHECVVIAPARIPRRASDRVKTGRRAGATPSCSPSFIARVN